MNIYVVKYYDEGNGDYIDIGERDCYFSTFEKAMAYVEKERREVFTDLDFCNETNDCYDGEENDYYVARARFNGQDCFVLEVQKHILDEEEV